MSLIASGDVHASQRIQRHRLIQAPPGKKFCMFGNASTLCGETGMSERGYEASVYLGTTWQYAHLPVLPMLL